jgi:hypothetical protein
MKKYNFLAIFFGVAIHLITPGSFADTTIASDKQRAYIKIEGPAARSLFEKLNIKKEDGDLFSSVYRHKVGPDIHCSKSVHTFAANKTGDLRDTEVEYLCELKVNLVTGIAENPN